MGMKAKIMHAPRETNRPRLSNDLFPAFHRQMIFGTGGSQGAALGLKEVQLI
jgi:hypothetical protein